MQNPLPRKRWREQDRVIGRPFSEQTQGAITHAGFLAILPYRTGDSGEIGGVSAAGSGKTAGIMGGMSDVKIAIKMLLGRSAHEITSRPEGEKRIAKSAKREENAKAFLTERLKDSRTRMFKLFRVGTQPQRKR